MKMLVKPKCNLSPYNILTEINLYKNIIYAKNVPNIYSSKINLFINEFINLNSLNFKCI